MIDDLDRMHIHGPNAADAALGCTCETCLCQCSCTQCECYCSGGDYAYDQDNTYLHYPSDRTSVSGNLVNTSQTDIWQQVVL